ncbi:unnamed protein product [Rotaria sp. Silwood2]|nr:unnamed protein product [Rotaria sp. Silwood2]CAF3390022.1 unnamed protein product [Rotaria sp. Silwood2]CAF4163773.1 unnamed protein product [Rotaria sp. Silwood2]CAF4333896.1 unnamed protein product [Rotaria sp. Silwood2]CAF4386428.1 unnamed protein product [Rotaria sp. Silwood2]
MEASESSAPNNLTDTIGEFNGVNYKIDHRDTNALLCITLQPNVSFYAQPGAMVAMSSEVTINGKFNFSFTELLTGGEMAQTTFTGPGEVLLSLSNCGNIVPIQLDGKTQWNIDRNAFLAMTAGIVKETKFQGFSKGMYSGENLFVDCISGVGIIFVKSSCAIVQRHLKQGEQWIVNNGHLVAWNCPYSIEKIGFSLMSGIRNVEAFVYRFAGPGTVFIRVNTK